MRHCFYCGKTTRQLRNKAQRLACTGCYDSEWVTRRDWHTSSLPKHLVGNDTRTQPGRKRIEPTNKKDTTP